MVWSEYSIHKVSEVETIVDNLNLVHVQNVLAFTNKPLVYENIHIILLPVGTKASENTRRHKAFTIPVEVSAPLGVLAARCGRASGVNCRHLNNAAIR